MMKMEFIALPNFVLNPVCSAEQLRPIVGLIHDHAERLGLKAASLFTPQIIRVTPDKSVVQDSRVASLYDGRVLSFDEQAESRHFLLNNITGILIDAGRSRKLNLKAPKPALILLATVDTLYYSPVVLADPNAIYGPDTMANFSSILDGIPSTAAAPFKPSFTPPPSPAEVCVR